MMLLASKLAKTVIRSVARRRPTPASVLHDAAPLHISSLPSAAPKVAPTKTVLSRFVQHITRAIPQLPSQQVIDQSLRLPASITVKQSFSLPSRIALSPRPFGSFHPRAPTLASGRSVAHVGLGTARSFSSARPVFQNIVQNVPVAARALAEADRLDLRSKASGQRRLKTLAAKKVAKRTDKVKTNVLFPVASAVEEPNAESFAHYFAPSTLEDVPSEPFITTVSIPLAPHSTPSSDLRAPLSDHLIPFPFDYSQPTFEVVTGLHLAFTEHSFRVAKLFTRLDGANVWIRGVSCEAIEEYDAVSPRELCLTFDGWTEDMVCRLLGDNVSWCSVTTVPRTTPSSFIMPTLDFSAAFQDASRSSDLYTARWVDSQMHDQGGEDSSTGWTDVEEQCETSEFDSVEWVSDYE